MRAEWNDTRTVAAHLWEVQKGGIPLPLPLVPSSRHSRCGLRYKRTKHVCFTLLGLAPPAQGRPP